MEGLLGALGVLLLLLVPAVFFVAPIVAWLRATEAKRRVDELALSMHEQLARTQQELMQARRAFDALELKVAQLGAAPPTGVTVAWPVPDPVRRPEPEPEPVQVPVALPVLEQVPVPMALPVLEQVPVSEPVSVPVLEQVPVSEPVSVPVLEPLPVSVPEPVPAPAPEAAAVRPSVGTPIPVEATPQEPPTLEERIGLVWFTRLGAAALLLGVAYFLKYAVDNAWIGPLGRLVAGVVAGLGLLGFAEHGRAKTKPVFTNVVVGAGLSVLLFSAYASHAFYELLPAPLATLAIAVISIGGGALAVRHRAEAILILSTCAALSAPVLLSSGKDQPALLFGYVGVVSVLAHYASVRGRFAFAPWIPIVGGAALYLGWYAKFFDGGQAASSFAAEPPVYETLAARAVPLGAVVLLSIEWLGLSLAGGAGGAKEKVGDEPTEGTSETRSLAYVVAALLFGTLGLGTLLFDHAVQLTTALVAVAAVAAYFARRHEAPGLFAWSELVAAAAFSAVATKAPADFAPVVVALLARSGLVCGALSVIPSAHRATPFVAGGLSLLVLLGGAAATLGPDHPQLFLGLLVAVSAAVAAIAHHRDVPIVTPIAMVLSFPFLFVGAPALAPLHRSSAPVDAVFLLLAGGWAIVYGLGAVSPVLTKRRPATATAVLTHAACCLLFVGLVLGYTPGDASVLRAAILVAVGAASLGLGLFVQRGGTSGLATVSFGLSLALFVAAVALLLSGVSVTLVWAAMACVLAVLASRERNDAWLGLAGVVALLVVCRLLAFDLGLPDEARAAYFRTGGAEGELFPRFLLHPRALSLFGTAAAFFVTAAAFRRDERAHASAIAHVASFIGHALALGLVVSEARLLAFKVPDLAVFGPLARAAAFDEAVAAQADAVGVVTTLALGGYAIGVLLLGFRARTALPRYVGLGLFLVALGKLGLYDIWYLPRIYQISALVGTGALLLSASFLYARFGQRLVRLIKDGASGPSAT